MGEPRPRCALTQPGPHRGQSRGVRPNIRSALGPQRPRGVGIGRHRTGRGERCPEQPHVSPQAVPGRDRADFGAAAALPPPRRFTPALAPRPRCPGSFPGRTEAERKGHERGGDRRERGLGRGSRLIGRSSAAPRAYIRAGSGRLRPGGTREATRASPSMLLKAALLLSLLAACPVPPAEAAQSGLWRYLSQLTGDKDSLERGHSKLGSDSTNLKESVQDGLSSVGGLLEKLSPLGRGLQPPRLGEDPGSLRKALRRELDSLRLQLSPYVDEVHQQVGRQLDELRQQLRPLTEELLDQVSLRARELRRHLVPSREVAAQLLGGADELQRFAAHYGDKIAFHTEQVKDIFRPYAERLLSEIHRNVQELHRGVAPHARASPEQLNRHIQELSAKLARNARDLHRQIQRNLEQLKAKLSLYPGGAAAAPGRSREALAREVQRRVEEFRRDAYAQIRAFTRALDQETEEMRLKLSARPEPPEGPPDAPPPPVEDLRARLDALWRELALSLSERGGEGPGEGPAGDPGEGGGGDPGR
ncbi:apolipoprotein A-V [Melospiza melodia melodia]|uniref:apolipoprotein A-V n=1 Tax=Melospiza melodia melodia TaxID=1914991 RepID=UPI002FD55CDA